MAMQISPNSFALKRYFFHTTELRALPDHDPEGEVAGTKQASEVSCQMDGKSIFVQLIVKSDIDESENPPYEYELGGVAVFECTSKALTDEQIKTGATIYGTQVLLGAAREIVLMLSSRSVWGGFTIQLNNVSPPMPEGHVE